MNTNDIKNANAIRSVGRPNENKAPEDTAKGFQVSLTPNEREKLVKTYGGLTKALKSLLKDDEK